MKYTEGVTVTSPPSGLGLTPLPDGGRCGVFGHKAMLSLNRTAGVDASMSTAGLVLSQ